LNKARVHIQLIAAIAYILIILSVMVGYSVLGASSWACG
jgi:hypothetical protein